MTKRAEFFVNMPPRLYGEKNRPRLAKAAWQHFEKVWNASFDPETPNQKPPEVPTRNASGKLLKGISKSNEKTIQLMNREALLNWQARQQSKQD